MAGLEEIRVHLSTESPLAPLYLAKFSQESTQLSPDYLAQVHQLLENDLKYNGFTQLLPYHVEKETLMAQKEIATAFNAQSWKEFGVAYAIKGVAKEKSLTFSVLQTQNATVKQFEPILLTGELSHDRRQIHKLSDSIVKVLFGKQGVASSRILYSVQEKGTKGPDSFWRAEIWECDWDGANPKQITKEKSYNISPLFLSTKEGYASDRFIYVSYKLSQPKIYAGSLHQNTGKRFISLKGNQLLPAISLKKDKLAFICDASGRADLFMQRLSPEGQEQGKPIQLFSYPKATQASPTFSPDGSQIAFVSDKDGLPRIYVIPAEAAKKRADARLITKQKRESSCPNWSPDGTKIAYSAKTDGVRQIWFYDCETQEETQLTMGPGNKENPFWAPDSLHLVFNSTDGETSELYVVNLHQPEAVKISSGFGKKHYPSWGN